MSEQSTPSTKKVIRIQTPLMEQPVSIHCTPEIEAMPMSEVLDTIAEQYTSGNRAAEAKSIRELAERPMLHDGLQKSVSTLVRDLRFEMKSTSSGPAMIADVSFNVPYPGGKY